MIFIKKLKVHIPVAKQNKTFFSKNHFSKVTLFSEMFFYYVFLLFQKAIKFGNYFKNVLDQIKN